VLLLLGYLQVSDQLRQTIEGEPMSGSSLLSRFDLWPAPNRVHAPRLFGLMPWQGPVLRPYPTQPPPPTRRRGNRSAHILWLAASAWASDPQPSLVPSKVRARWVQPAHVGEPARASALADNNLDEMI